MKNKMKPLKSGVKVIYQNVEYKVEKNYINPETGKLVIDIINKKYNDKLSVYQSSIILKN